ncbi:actin-related protein 5-like [Pollicipes pollicipes]|uniref:actin-related protein 5-like n=1 Tax=Pollicipes pollicipes TaxID=41117 RepID=UPI001884E1EE|nr:actin-related protein 5-like [Pollicipes pollicipes]
MELYHFKDSRPIPDKMFAYTDDLKGVPLVIDNGSYTAKVGWANQPEPAMIFKNLITKVRKERTKKDLETQIGNDIANLEAGRLNLRTQFDRGVVTHFEAQETLLDYSLTHLGVNTPGGLHHPVVISEPPANINLSRAAMSELLFECYRVPSVSYFVDALASLQQNQPDCRDALVISCGYHATHVIPVLDGRMDAANARRIGVGGFLMCSYLQRLLQLKFPSVMASITLSRAEEILHELAGLAVDYPSELAHWAEPAHREQRRRRLQLPLSAAVSRESGPEPPAVDAVRDRKRNAQARMLEMHRKKRQAMVADDERKLARLRQSPHRTAASQQRMRIISQLAQRDTKEDTFGQRDEDWDLYKTINTEGGDSDSEADTEELAELEGRLRQLAPDLPRRQQPAGSSAELHQIELTTEALQTPEVLFQPSLLGMSQAGLAETVQFVLNKQPAAEQQRLADNVFITGGLARLPGFQARMERELRQMRPFQTRADKLYDRAGIDTACALCTGVPCWPAGLTILSCVSAPVPAGGCFVTLLSAVPSFRVTLASRPSLDAWLGARALAAAGRLGFVSRQQYDECGAEFLAEHLLSNPFWPSPDGAPPPAEP